MQGENVNSAPFAVNNEIDFQIGNGGIFIIILFAIIIAILITVLIIVCCVTKAKIKSLQMRIDNNLTDEETELLEKALKLNDDSKAKIADILSKSTDNSKQPPQDGN